jgi:GNAT superfamily N-acetyltransferase
MTAPVIRPVRPADAGELLALQRAAYVTEAQLYGDINLPPLVQTLDELVSEIGAGPALAAQLGYRIAGAVRGRISESVLHIGRLTVAPDMQGKGIGSALLAEIEKQAPPIVDRFALFTGHLSHGNLRLYERLGYREDRREELRPGVILVHLAKPRT